MARTRAVVVATVLAATSAPGVVVGAGPAHGEPLRPRRPRGRRRHDRRRVRRRPHRHRPGARRRHTGDARSAKAGAVLRSRGRGVHGVGGSRERWFGLESDVETRDKYGRRLAYVYVDGRRFDDELLRLGYGRLLVIEPNSAHAAHDAGRRARGAPRAPRPLGRLLTDPSARGWSDGCGRCALLRRVRRFRFRSGPAPTGVVGRLPAEGERDQGEDGEDRRATRAGRRGGLGRSRRRWQWRCRPSRRRLRVRLRDRRRR